MLGSGQTGIKPVRVVRNYKGRKSSEYAPEERDNVRRDLQDRQVLAREEQESVHCLKVPV